MRRLDTLNWKSAEFPRLCTSRPDADTFYTIEQVRSAGEITLTVVRFGASGDSTQEVIAARDFTPGPIMRIADIRKGLKEAAERFEGLRLQAT